ncbi:alpha/beta hydrolase [Bacillus badius]|uniref:YqkD n=1 Tax=Bacillus badius TaxID=1455 RepID=A0ABR5AYJ3_BACBA|nr:alpha/beta hydrolase [Bacillus badius]KIL75208.1 YqkD [Bacillus badius]KIL79807.1 YqkD [Bacillus badius]MED4715110.1 alpha/beta hydrolase [Bacillus badius]
MKRWITALGSGAMLTAAAGFYLSSRVLHMRKKNEDLIYRREVEAKRLDIHHYNQLPKEEVWIASPFGYRLKAVFVTPHPGRPYVIFCHGVTETKINSIKYMNLFLERGFNGVIYDHRRHGESGGDTTSYGYYEKEDLQAVVNELIRREGTDVSFGIHGESMGAATLLLYAGLMEDRADFYIADCPFSDFQAQLTHQMKREIKAAPQLLVHLASWSVLLRGRFRLSDISPLQAVKNIKKPVLFIHSEEDTFILPDMTKTLYKEKRDPKAIYLAPKGAHAQSYNENPEAYAEAIDRFLHTYYQTR